MDRLTLATDTHAALVELLERLDAAHYDFVTPTPSTVRRWGARARPSLPSLRDIFGWGARFGPDALDSDWIDVLRRADALDEQGAERRCRLRAARVEGRLFLHSAFAGAGASAVFVGPDSYRFAALIRREIGAAGVRSVLDVGAGAGVGAITAGALAPGARVFASDINAAALRLASANAAHAGVAATFQLADGLSGARSPLDLILANPPYVAGDSGRTYKDGGGDHGERLALDWASAALDHLAPGGRFILYTGSPVRVGGHDIVRAGLKALVRGTDFKLSYGEIDPDVFSGELRRAAYDEIERIAAVGAVIRRAA